MTLAYNETRYEIRASEYRCEGCGEEVPCESFYHSAVFHDGEGFARKDFCTPCWTKLPRADEGAGAPLPGVYAFWRTRRPPLPSARPRAMRFDVALVSTFFRRLMASPAVHDSPPTAAGAAPPAPDERDELAFVFALLLIRNKVLQLVSTVEDEGMEWLKIAEKKDPQVSYRVKNPNLSAAQLERVKVRIGELLQMQV